MAHAWEFWSDARAYDGTATILQPQALPLYDGIDVHTMVALFTEPAPAPRAGCGAGDVEKPDERRLRAGMARCAGERRCSKYRQPESERVVARGCGKPDSRRRRPITR